MLLLSVESSAVTASAALTDGGTVIKSEFINNGLTHSETLLPLIESVMSGYDYSLLDAVAVTAGPVRLPAFALVWRRLKESRFRMTFRVSVFQRLRRSRIILLMKTL